MGARVHADLDAFLRRLLQLVERNENLGPALDDHPLLPTSGAVRAALDAMADRLAKHGVKVARTNPLLPELARVGRTFIQMLSAIFAADYPDDVYARLQSRAAALPPEAAGVSATRLRGNVMSYREWVRADRMCTVSLHAVLAFVLLG